MCRYIAMAALALTAQFILASATEAQVCVRDQDGRVVCGEPVNPYEGRQGYYQPAPRYYDDDDELPIIRGPRTWQECPQGMVPSSRGDCQPWRPSRGSECPPGMTLQSGRCQPYRGP